MKIEILKSCIMVFNGRRCSFIFQQKIELKDEYAHILINGKYARKITIVETIKDAIASKSVQSDQIENKAILSDSLENKEPVISRRGRGRPTSADEK